VRPPRPSDHHPGAVLHRPAVERQESVAHREQRVVVAEEVGDTGRGGPCEAVHHLVLPPGEGPVGLQADLDEMQADRELVASDRLAGRRSKVGNRHPSLGVDRQGRAPGAGRGAGAHAEGRGPGAAAVARGREADLERLAVAEVPVGEHRVEPARPGIDRRMPDVRSDPDLRVRPRKRRPVAAGQGDARVRPRRRAPALPAIFRAQERHGRAEQLVRVEDEQVPGARIDHHLRGIRPGRARRPRRDRADRAPGLPAVDRLGN